MEECTFIVVGANIFIGIVPLIDGYLEEAFKYVKKAGGVTIADEVQTGITNPQNTHL